MDLSKSQKTRRDAVEEPLRLLEKLLHDLEECRTRTDAALKVWPETRRTLEPALIKQDEISRQLTDLQNKFSQLWSQGFAKKWKEL